MSLQGCVQEASLDMAPISPPIRAFPRSRDTTSVPERVRPMSDAAGSHEAHPVANVAGEEGISADEVILPANAADACSIPLLQPPAIARQPQDVPRPPRIGARIKCTSDSGCDLGVVLDVTEFLPGSMGGPKTGLSVQAQLGIRWDRHGTYGATCGGTSTATAS